MDVNLDHMSLEQTESVLDWKIGTSLLCLAYKEHADHWKRLLKRGCSSTMDSSGQEGCTK